MALLCDAMARLMGVGGPEAVPPAWTSRLRSCLSLLAGRGASEKHRAQVHGSLWRSPSAEPDLSIPPRLWEGEAGTEVFHLPAHPPECYSSQVWAPRGLPTSDCPVQLEGSCDVGSPRPPHLSLLCSLSPCASQRPLGGALPASCWLFWPSPGTAGRLEGQAVV